MILRLYLEGGTMRDLPGRIAHDPAEGRTSIVVDWPAELDRMAVVGFTLTATTESPLVIEAGETLMLPLPPVIGLEP